MPFDRYLALLEQHARGDNVPTGHVPSTFLFAFVGPRIVGRFGLSRVLVMCNEDNIGSIRTIEKNGGVLENIVSGPDVATPKRRYWIDATGREASP